MSVYLEQCDFENCIYNNDGGCCTNQREYENCKFMDARNDARLADEAYRKLKEQYEFEPLKKSRDCILDNITINKLDEYWDEVKTIYAK